MPDHVALDLAYVAPVTCVPLRARKERVVHARGVVTVPVAVYGDRDAPVVFQAREGTLSYQRRLLGGALLGPVDQLSDGWAMGGWYNVNRFRFAMESPAQVAKMVFGWKQPWSGDHHDAEALPAMERILHDGRPGVEAAVREAARGLAVIDGQVYSRQRPPALMVTERSALRAEIIINDRYDPPHHYSFGVARMAALEEFVERNSGSGGYRWNSDDKKTDVRITVMEPTVLAYAEDRPNAWVAARKALEAVREMNGTMPAAVFLHMAKLAEARDAVLAGAMAPEGVAELLRGFDALRPLMPGRPVAVKNLIRIGLDAIASSWAPPALDADLAEDDAHAMDGLAPGL